ncbi:uncharacterized protein LOC111006095 [Momordica charantia]|uniref:Uncharacterized protein LOC111006095 n=1 Tax=Momordica charantia TaxID=3673 RepID=A0A6J1BVI8_MOMCH|nr:uncharacterized protein LOC111006095 [Momordica charantia]
MAIEAVCPDISVPAMSPRISFSHDFCQSEAIPVEQRPKSRSNSSGLNSSIDFDFCIRECSDQESSSADEIFSHGRILPLEIKKKPEDPPVLIDQSSSAPAPLARTRSLDADVEKCLKKDRSSKEIKAANSDSEEKQSSNSKSFWRFKRSSSCGSGYTHSLCPLPLLSRSNSTGSAPNIKRTPLSKDGASHKQSSHRNSSKTSSSHSQCSSSMGYQKPPLKKVHGSYGNGVQVNPILNVHSGNLFGLGSIFSSAKDRSKKK